MVSVEDSSTHVCYKDGAGDGHNNGQNGAGAFYVCRKTSYNSLKGNTLHRKSELFASSILNQMGLVFPLLVGVQFR